MVPFPRDGHILEEHGTRLAGRRTLSDLVRFVRELEEKNILEEIKGKKISITFLWNDQNG